MYHSCQHRQPTVAESKDHPEQHTHLMTHMVCNCDAVLWFWATYESAQYCLLARLRTPLGMPPDTFTAIESELTYMYIQYMYGYMYVSTHCIAYYTYTSACVCVCVCVLDVLRGYAQEVESTDRRHLRDTPSSFSGHMGAGIIT